MILLWQKHANRAGWLTAAGRGPPDWRPRTPQAPIQLQPVDGLEGAVLLNDGEEDLGGSSG